MIPSEKAKIWIDVRTPSEYDKAHVVGAYNIPLFTDEERAAVGTTYVNRSREEAIREGLRYVGPRLDDIIGKTIEIAGAPESAPPLMLYCARGGMRSQSVAWLLRLYGFEVETYPGGLQGYKRRLQALVDESKKLVVIEGPTGSGKTELLYHLKDMGAQIIDLEGLGKHKGSAFGYLPGVKQPSGEMFGCLLQDALEYLDRDQPIYLESESQKIGSVQIPEVFFNKMKEAKVISIVQPLEERAKRILTEYSDLPKDFLIQSFEKISQRLGSENANKAIQMVRDNEYEMPVLIALKYYDKAYQRSGNELWSGDRTYIDVINGDLKNTAIDVIDKTRELFR